jgi:hypothetical protein
LPVEKDERLELESVMNIEQTSSKTRGGMNPYIEIISTSPLDCATEISVDTSIVIIFSKSIDTEIFPQTLSIDPNVKGVYTWSNDNKTVTFLPNEAMEDYTTYTVTISDKLKSADGNYSLSSDYTWSFTVSHGEPDFYELVLGPFLDDNDKPIEGAKVTITIEGLEFTGMTDPTGYVLLYLPNQPPAGLYNVKVTKLDYVDMTYSLEVDEAGLYSSQPPMMEKEVDKPDQPFIPGFEGILLFFGMILIILLSKRYRLR